MTTEKIKEVLRKHKIWLDGEGGERADFRSEDLDGVTLIGVDFEGANFEGASLYEANLEESDFSKTNFEGVDLRGANLVEADFTGANLRGANLNYTDLSKARFYKANLCNTRLSSAVLSRTDFIGANLYGVILDENEKIRKGIIVSDKMIGYKKCIGNTIVKLEIPRGAIVFSINNNKCRTNKCKVLEITDVNGNKIDRAFSQYKHFSYYVGDEIEMFNFNTQYNEECGKGIHFFRTKEEAEKYVL